MKSILPIFFLLFCSCKKAPSDLDCPIENHNIVETIPFADSTARLQNIDESKGEVNLIIKSESDYQKLVSSSDQLPEIDFTKYTLICGQKTYPHCVTLDKVEVIEKCGNLEHQLHVNERTCGGFETLHYFTLIPASYTKQTVVLFREVWLNR